MEAGEDHALRNPQFGGEAPQIGFEIATAEQHQPRVRPLQQGESPQ